MNSDVEYGLEYRNNNHEDAAGVYIIDRRWAANDPRCVPSARR